MVAAYRLQEEAGLNGESRGQPVQGTAGLCCKMLHFCCNTLSFVGTRCLGSARGLPVAGTAGLCDFRRDHAARSRPAWSVRTCSIRRDTWHAVCDGTWKHAHATRRVAGTSSTPMQARSPVASFAGADARRRRTPPPARRLNGRPWYSRPRAMWIGVLSKDIRFAQAIRSFGGSLLL